MRVITDFCWNVSDKAKNLYKDLGGTCEHLPPYDHDEVFAEVCERLGSEVFADGHGSYLLYDMPDIYRDYHEIKGIGSGDEVVYNTHKLLADKLENVDIEELDFDQRGNLLQELQGAIIPKHSGEYRDW